MTTLFDNVEVLGLLVQAMGARSLDPGIVASEPTRSSHPVDPASDPGGRP